MPSNPPTTLRTQRLNSLQSTPGIYALALRIDVSNTIQIGRLGNFTFSTGDYLYLGSARGPGGIAARIRRHLRDDSETQRHWHIDWLWEIAHPTGLIWSHAINTRECEWAIILKPFVSRGPSRFGASDCRCEGHLLRLKTSAELQHAVRALRGVSTSEVHLQFLEHAFEQTG
jgi:Uri superfamily endonuclease